LPRKSPKGPSPLTIWPILAICTTAVSTVDPAIVDFDMPGMNGRDLLLRMRALHTRFPILLLSGSVSTLSPETRLLFQVPGQGYPVRYLLDCIAAFLDPNEIPDFGS
jgi:CheY-like chemotaxis protein